MKKFKVYTKWIGYSEIEVEAKSEEKAREIVDEGSYDPNKEKFTFNGLDYGGDEEEIYDVEEIKNK
tara:strand:+ start:2438 stop:2635 length:198 start_codon:yes stop_codon:yes gene_type:complete